MRKVNQMIKDIERKIEEKTLSLKEVEDLLLETSWLDEPELIRKLLAYKTLPQDSLPMAKKTDAEVKAEWKTEKLQDGTLRLASYKGNDTVVIVPEKIGKALVTELGSYVFSVNQPRIKKELKENRAKIKEIRMSDAVREIGIGAFSGCEQLEKVALSNSIIMIPDETFADCKRLKSISIPESVEQIGRIAFNHCESLEQIIIPEGVRRFYTTSNVEHWYFIETFGGCINLKKVVLPDSMTEISGYSFVRCINLTDIKLPPNLVKIEEAAFYGCKKLLSLTIPQSVKQISDNAFGDCKKLTLHVTADSYAEQYAIKAGIRYVMD